LIFFFLGFFFFVSISEFEKKKNSFNFASMAASSKLPVGGIPPRRLGRLQRGTMNMRYSVYDLFSIIRGQDGAKSDMLVRGMFDRKIFESQQRDVSREEKKKRDRVAHSADA
jgi:hypothetical protein